MSLPADSTRLWLRLPLFLRARLHVQAMLLGKPIGAIIQEAIELHQALLREIYQRRLREVVLTHMAQSLSQRERCNLPERFQEQMEGLRLSQAFLVEISRRRWGPEKDDYPHPIEWFLERDQRDQSKAFWKMLESPGNDGEKVFTRCRDLMKRDAEEILEEERNEILDLATLLDRLRIAYDPGDLFDLAARSRLISIAKAQHRKEEERLNRFNRK